MKFWANPGESPQGSGRRGQNTYNAHEPLFNLHTEGILLGRLLKFPIVGFKSFNLKVDFVTLGWEWGEAEVKSLFWDIPVIVSSGQVVGRGRVKTGGIVRSIENKTLP